MKQYKSILLVLALVSVVSLPHMISAASFQAADVVGQRRFGSPAFTINGANNAPNDLGLSVPFGVAVDVVDQRMFVADGNARILVYNLTAAGLLATTTPAYVLGAPDAFTLGTSTLSEFEASAQGLAYDALNSRLFMADPNRRVLVFDVATSTITNFAAASYVLGSPDFTSIPPDGSTSSTLGSPRSLAYDSPNQRLFVGEADNRRVTVFDVAISTITNGQPASYVLGHDDFTTQIEASMTSSTFADAGNTQGPGALAYDPDSTRLFAMQAGGNRILVFDVATSTITDGMAASYVLGQPDFDTSDPDTSASTLTGDNTDYSTANGGLAYDRGGQRLFVSDSGNNRVLVFDVATSTIANGISATHVLGQPDFDSADGGTSSHTLTAPTFLDYHSGADKLMAVDHGNNRVLIFDVAAVADDEPAVDVIGHVVDGQKTFDYGGGDNGPGVSGFESNADMALDTVAHRLFVADTENNRVIAFDLDADNDFLDYDADYVLGQPDMYTDSEGVSAVKLTTPQDLAIDPVGRRLFVAGGNDWRVLVFDITSLSDGEAAIHVLGQPDFTSDSQAATTTARTLSSGDLLYDASSTRLFISDRDAGRVLVFDADVSELADYMPASNILGKPDFAASSAGDSSGMNTSSTMFAPKGLAYDVSSNRLFVADSTFGRVLVFSAATSSLVDGMAASYVLGQPDFTATGSGTSSSTLSQPEGLAYDALHERLFVADSNNNRVVGFNVATSTMVNGKAASVVLGQPDFTSSDDLGPTATSMTFPTDVLYDDLNRRLYVADTENHRIMAYNHVKITTLTLPEATVGESYAEEIDTENEQGDVTFELAQGSLPPGMVIGSVDGTPTTPGDYTFTIQASDMVNGSGVLFDDQTYTLRVNAASAEESGGGGGGRSGRLAYGPPVSTSTPISTPPAPGSAEALKNQIESLLAQIAELRAKLGLPPLGGNTADRSATLFARDLTIGSRGADVKRLQQFLNSHGFALAASGPGSPGQETEQFGLLTRSALSKFQDANGISPAVGYFGPKTRAFVNNLLSSGQ